MGRLMSQREASLLTYAPSRADDGLHPLRRRVLATLPPVLAWIVLTSPVWAAIAAPHVLGGFLVVFAAYWLWRSVEFSLGLLVGLWQLWRARHRDWLADGQAQPGFDDLRHVVIVPTYKESDDVLAETLDSLVRQTLPSERI